MLEERQYWLVLISTRALVTLGSLLILQIPIMSQIFHKIYIYIYHKIFNGAAPALLLINNIASNLVDFSTILLSMVLAIMLISNFISRSAGNIVV